MPMPHQSCGEAEPCPSLRGQCSHRRLLPRFSHGPEKAPALFGMVPPNGLFEGPSSPFLPVLLLPHPEAPSSHRHVPLLTNTIPVLRVQGA